MRYEFIEAEKAHFPVIILCQVMGSLAAASTTGVGITGCPLPLERNIQHVWSLFIPAWPQRKKGSVKCGAYSTTVDAGLRLNRDVPTIWPLVRIFAYHLRIKSFFRYPPKIEKLVKHEAKG